MEYLRRRLKQLTEVDLWRQLSIGMDRRITGRILIARNARIRLESSGKIEIHSGSLTFGKSWGRSDPFPSYMFVDRSAKVIVTGNFAMYSGARLHVMEGAILAIGGGGYANHDLHLDCFSEIRIGCGVAIASNVTIRDSDNKARSLDGVAEHKPIRIGDHVWIGMNATILKGVTIGDGAVIAACSVVTRDVPARSLAAGVPARIVKQNVFWSD